MQIEFSKNKYIEPYLNYSSLKSKFLEIDDLAQPYLNYNDFADKALFFIDCSRQNENLKSSTADIKLGIEAHVNFPTQTSVLCLIIHDALIQVFPLSNLVKNIL